MIRCPLCGSSSSVRFVRERNNGDVYRKRDCQNPDCKAEFSTVERVVGARGTFSGVSVLTLANLLEEAGIEVDRSEFHSQNDYRSFLKKGTKND